MINGFIIQFPENQNGLIRARRADLASQPCLHPASGGFGVLHKVSGVLQRVCGAVDVPRLVARRERSCVG